MAANTPLGRIGEPEDVGAAVAFLPSDAAGWITGETLATVLHRDAATTTAELERLFQIL